MCLVELAFYYFRMCLQNKNLDRHYLLPHWLYVISVNCHGLSMLDLILSIFCNYYHILILWVPFLCWKIV
jgi:hypothetical protein